jgi:hypothetical protein
MGGNLRTRFKSYRSEVIVSKAIDRLQAELRRLGARDAVLSTNLRLGLRGEPLSGQPEPKDRGVAVYFKLKGKDRVLACDLWTSVAGNIAAIAAHIDALRRIERYGVGTLEQAFAGYDSLPAPGADNDPPWRKVLGLNGGPVTEEQVSAAYRELAKVCHPDLQGGSHEAMAQLNRARDKGLAEIGAPAPTSTSRTDRCAP